MSMTFTENGALTHATSGSALLDLFAMGGALRNRSDKEVDSLFRKAFKEDALNATKVAFYLRDIRGGQGERKTFRTILSTLASSNPEVVRKNLEHIVEYGRWDDLLVLLNSELEIVVLDFMKNKFFEDKALCNEGKSFSLLAKWLPSENASSQTTKAYAKKIRKYFGMSSKEYRKSLSVMRKALDIVERKASSGKWEDINYSIVPSKAALMYRGAFYKHDATRYANFVNAVKEGVAKINTATIYPYEIVSKILYNRARDEALMALWDNLPNYAGDDKNALVVADVSGSMTGLPMAMSISLAIYFAERNKGIFKNCFMTFSTRPAIVELKGKNLVEKIHNVSKAHWSMSTNLQATFDVILNAAVKGAISESDMPSTLYIISDMEFDACVENGKKTNFDAIKEKYDAAGYHMPTLVFWNVNSRNNNLPVRYNENGVALVSGNSPSVFKMSVTGNLDPYAFMMNTIGSERYNRIAV